MYLAAFICFCVYEFALFGNADCEVMMPIATTTSKASTESLIRYEDDYGEAKVGTSRQGRGMMDDYSDHDHEDDDHQEMKEEMVEQKAVKTDPWAGYYDFIINEGSFKFWAAFQLGTALLLAYSAFAAVYYAKFNPITSDYDYYDDFIFRSNGRSAPSTNAESSWFGMDAQTFQRIINAITPKKHS